MATILYTNEKLNWETEKFDTSYLCNNAYGFKILENEIDIQTIKEIENEVMKDDWRYYVPIFFNKINDLVRIVKQLDNKLNNT